MISVLYRALGGDPDDPTGRAGFAADLRAVSPVAFRRAFADANDNHRFSRAELSASCPTLLVAGEREPGAMVEAWITGQELPPELAPETTSWPSSHSLGVESGGR